ncbi:MAG TPA: hypothetical protein PLP17_16125, partial [Oligoflexia bacterium]|nr:hypothetical protein [Oligoflexia bacterium]
MTTSEKEINDQAQEAEHGVPEDDYAFLRGTVVRVTYHNQDSGFAVIKAEPESGTRDPHNTSSALATIVGPVPPTI